MFRPHVQRLLLILIAAAAPSFRGVKITVLAYHHILHDEENQTEADNPWTISTENFERQMRYLYENGYKTLTLDELYGFLYNKIKVPKECTIANFGTIYRNELFYLQPTYIDLDTKLIGQMLAEAALSRIENINMENTDYIYQPNLVIGNAEKSLVKKMQTGGIIILKANS